MRRTSQDAKSLKTIAQIRDLQMRAARLASARADADQRAAETRLEEKRAAVRAVVRGWTASVESPRFDPAVSGSWLGSLATCQNEERALGAAAAQAKQEADLGRGRLREAQARSDASATEARLAARAVARRRDEAQLAAVEDQLGSRRRRT